MKSFLFILVFGFCLQAQHLWQKPKAPLKKEVLQELIGPLKNKSLSREIKILWLYGYDKHHIPGAHDYVKVKDLMLGLLKSVPKITVDEAFQFPTEQQFAEADVICMYLHFENLSDQKITQLQNYIEAGGRVIALHESVIIRPSEKGQKLSKCLGCAWNEGQSKWGALFDEIKIDNSHPIFKNFPAQLSLSDEFYWNLHQQENIHVIGKVKSGPPRHSKKPASKDQLSKEYHPVFWTYELGKGRVFATSAGHNTFTYYDPEFRLVLFRAMTWCLQEPIDPFIPLVYQGIEKDGLIGTTDPMRYWKGKKRR